MPRIPVEGDIPATPGAPGPGQGGPPAPEQGFGPRQRAKRLLRQAAGLQPASDVQPSSGLAPAIEAALNLQRAEGLITQGKFEKALGRGAPTVAAPTSRTSAATSTASRRDLRSRARRLRARRAGLIAGATQAASGPLGATPGLLPSVTDLFNSRRRAF